MQATLYSAPDPRRYAAKYRINCNCKRPKVIYGSERDLAGYKLRLLFDYHAINSHQYTLARSILRLCNAAARDNTVARDQAIDVLDAVQPLIQEYMSWILKDRVLKDKTAQRGLFEENEKGKGS